MFSNAEILAAVVTKWAMPLATTIMSDNLEKFPFLHNIQEKMMSSGWVGKSWSIAQELTPFAEPIVRSVVTPVLTGYIKNVPDECIPQLAHEIVDSAIANGGLKILDGRITFDSHDLENLKKLLNANLHITDKSQTYKVREE